MQRVGVLGVVLTGVHVPMTSWIRRLSPKAIVAGAVVDIVATNLALAPLAVWVFARDPARRLRACP